MPPMLDFSHAVLQYEIKISYVNMSKGWALGPSTEIRYRQEAGQARTAKAEELVSSLKTGTKWGPIPYYGVIKRNTWSLF